jgi:hypothetical protein
MRARHFTQDFDRLPPITSLLSTSAAISVNHLALAPPSILGMANKRRAYMRICAPRRRKTHRREPEEPPLTPRPQC